MIEKTRKLDSIELLPDNQIRVKFSEAYRDSDTGKEDPVRDPTYSTLSPSTPAHASAISLAKSLWTQVSKLGKVT